MAVVRDVEWGLEGLESGGLKLQSVSFFLLQPTSSCFQETENSMNVRIGKDSVIHLSQFLQVLGTANGGTLRNLEFHLVEWEVQQAKQLRMLLENNRSIKQLMLRRNRFNAECLWELSNALTGIKEMMLTESGIGSEGAGILASSLKDNHSLEELQIWEDSIGSKGAEELSKMIEVNSTLKLLTIFDSKSITATPLISAVLARNRSMEVHIWCVDHKDKSSKVVEFVPENSTLRVYQLDISGACRVACSLGWNSTVRSLDMTGVKLKSRWAREFRWVLEQNRTLEKLYLDGNWFGGVGIEHLLCPLSKFSVLQNQANTTLKSVTLGGRRTKIGRDGLTSILQMLSSNQSIAFLGIYNDESLKPENIIQIFKSLETNATLRRLSLQGCKGVKSEAVLETIMETLNVNPWIEDIDLTLTPLHLAGKTEGIYQRLGQNERSELEIDLLNDMQMTAPKSCRVFLCGQEYAGKTTICNSIAQNMAPSKLPYLEQVRILVNPVEQAVRTPGMKIRTFKDEDTKISIWNLSGQHEFYSLHDLMFPGHGSASFFLIISSLFKKPSNREPKTPSEIEEDIQYWLRFIVSNSKRAVKQCMLPSVTMVLTHYDKMNPQSDISQATVSLIQGLREKFQGFVEFYPTVFTVDARSSASVGKLSHHIRKTSRTILERVPRVYQLCNDLVEMLSDWRHENHNKPAMKWKEFGDLCQVKVPALRIRSRHDHREKTETRRRAVATSLHHIGEVIYFDELGFLILDCEWFCSEILSQIIRLDVRKQSCTEKSGFICRKDFEKILKGGLQSNIPGMGSNVFDNLDASDLIKMMLKLELCCEQDPSDPDSPLLIPSNLDEGTWRPQKWQVNSSDNNYVGRRLQCDDSSHMFLTPGFFPRLQASHTMSFLSYLLPCFFLLYILGRNDCFPQFQVHLHNKIMVLKNQHGGASYSLEKYLISININGIHVRIELGGQLGYFIDVLACSTKSPTEMLRLFQHLIIPAIQSLCHGITLMEYVLRSVCVKNLTPGIQL